MAENNKNGKKKFLSDEEEIIATGLTLFQCIIAGGNLDEKNWHRLTCCISKHTGKKSLFLNFVSIIQRFHCFFFFFFCVNIYIYCRQNGQTKRRCP